jgi:abequosyltransferase
MRVSLCIPTYNRASQLRPLLDSIVAQAGHSLVFQVAISDNASTDDTTEVVTSYRDAGLPVVYHRFDTNMGFDRNVMNAVAIASGEFCWLFGSDDILEPGAFARVEAALTEHADLSGLSIGSQGYSPDLSRHVTVNDHISTDFSSETVLSGRDQIIGTIGAWLGFMSSLIVRRSLWQAAVHSGSLEPYMHGYIHLYLIAKMLDEQSSWLCVPDRLVGCRTGNESFLAKDEFARTKLDIVGYDLAFGDVLGRENHAYRNAMTKVATFYVRTHFLGAKLKGASRAYWQQAVPMSVAFYWRYPTFWTKTFPIVVTPRFAMLAARTIYRRTIKPLRDGNA